MTNLGGNFGPVLKEWFRRNEWPQVVAERVARAKGSKIGPWASQMSNTMSGKLEPKPNFFKALGWFNNVILTRDFQGITDRRLMDQLKGSEALCHDDGQPFTATDFFSLYLGELEAPEDYKQTDGAITEEHSNMFWDEIRTAFKELSLESMRNPKDIWVDLRQRVAETGMSPDELDWLQEVLAGLSTPTLEESLRQRAKYPDMPVLSSLMRMKEESGGDLSRLKKFEIGCSLDQKRTQECPSILPSRVSR